MRCEGWVFVIATICLAAAPARAGFIVTYNSPSVQTADPTALCANDIAHICSIGTENFDARSTGTNQTFTTAFPIVSIAGNSYAISGTYTGVEINQADQYGGAGGSGKYAVTFTTAGYTLALSTTNPNGVNYFGFWLSALDKGNMLYFYNGGALVYTFTPTDMLNLVGTCPNSSGFCGNPNSDHLHANNGQPYAFLNFFDIGSTFTRIVFSENPLSGGYESDNQTVGYATALSGTVLTTAEPVSAAVLLAGLAGLGMMRRRRSAADGCAPITG